MYFRRMKIALLSLGMVGGFAAGAMSLHCRAHRRAAFEHHVARVCVEAARADAQAHHPRGYAPRW